jgi:hypothetical protein
LGDLNAIEHNIASKNLEKFWVFSEPANPRSVAVLNFPNPGEGVVENKLVKLQNNERPKGGS